MKYDCKHKWVEVDGTRTASGATYTCEICDGRMSMGPGTIVPERTFDERVIDAVVADLKANGKIRMAILGLYDPGRERDA